ncbi:MAG: ParB N-terminal domain-containing protein [Candidatus Hodarchaeota archaeon]
MGYLISHPKLELEIKLEEIKKLKSHEQFIPCVVEPLSDEIKQGIIKHPVIVDRETLLILDGIHRVAALQNLGYKLIPVCLVDYNNPSIKVGSWFRIVKSDKKSNENIRKDLEELGYDLEEILNNELRKEMCAKKIIIGIVTLRKCYGIRGKIGSIKEVYDYIKHLEISLRSVGYDIGYETEGDAVYKVKSNEALAAIIAPRIAKRDVVAATLSREVFAHKSTRHVIPARPLFVNVPIEWLGMDLKEANKLLLEYLCKKKITHLPVGQMLDRRYEEELYVFGGV